MCVCVSLAIDPAVYPSLRCYRYHCSGCRMFVIPAFGFSPRNQRRVPHDIVTCPICVNAANKQARYKHKEQSATAQRSLGDDDARFSSARIYLSIL